MTVLIIVAGIWSYIKTPLEAFPDVTNTQIIYSYPMERPERRGSGKICDRTD